MGVKLIALTILLVLLEISGGAATVGKPSPAPQSTLVPVYVPSPPSYTVAACPGSTEVFRLDYWPVNGETYYLARFVANGGHAGGSVDLILPEGYEAGVTIPADGDDHAYSLDVTTPSPGGGGAIQVELSVSTGYACNNGDHVPLVVRDVNLFVGP